MRLAGNETDPWLLLKTNLDALTGELARVVQETLQPEGVSVWLQQPEGAKVPEARGKTG